MESIKRKVITEKGVWCPRRKNFDRIQQLEKCENCLFCNQYSDNEIECYYNNDILLHGMHVTSFISGNNRYEIKKLTDEIYAKNKDIIDKEDSVCPLCCFNQKLANGKEYCLLRSSSNDDNALAFCCYEDEYWAEKNNE